MNTIWKENKTFRGNSTERGESLWVQNRKTNRPRLEGNVNTEVAVIGAGLAGVLTAYMLKQRGIPVVLLECREAGSGITKNTTAKITSQHGLIYRKLMMYKGHERAWQYAQSNQMAIDKYAEIVKDLGIDCDFEILPNYIYTLDNEMRIIQEVEAALKIGLPAEFVRETSLPFPVKAAVCFQYQAQFHPLKFLDAVAKELTIYENTRVLEIRDDGLITTEFGKVKAKQVVMATHYPCVNIPGFYFLRLHQERHYLTALEGGIGDNHWRLDGMYLDADPQGYTFRNYGDYLIMGSGNHRTGQHNPLNAYQKIEAAARKWYPNASIKYTWSNQDCITPDSIPYIGRYSAITPNIYVATGFNKWGMTSSMVSAMILSDMIEGKENEFQKVFNPRRLMFSGSRVFVKDATVITKSLIKEYLRIPQDNLKAIAKGQAGVILYKGKRVGVYRDLQDKYYFVKTKCPHLGCSLEWNQNELTWDCPCHGSRFDYRGRLINNPAMSDTQMACKIKKKDIKER